MKFSPNNKAGPVIFAYIEANPDCTVQEICNKTGIAQSTVERNLRDMLKAGAIRVSVYHPVMESSGKWPRGFKVGSGPSAPRPKLNTVERHLRKLDQQLQRRRMERVQREAKEMGAFGILVAQMVVKSKPRTRLRK